MCVGGCSDRTVTVGVYLMMLPYNEADTSVHSCIFPLHDPHYSPMNFTTHTWQKTDVNFVLIVKGTAKIKRRVLKRIQTEIQTLILYYSCLVIETVFCHRGEKYKEK